MRSYWETKGDDGKTRKCLIDTDKGIYYYSGYAKDFQDTFEIKEPSETATKLLGLTGGKK